VGGSAKGTVSPQHVVVLKKTMASGWPDPLGNPSRAGGFKV